MTFINWADSEEMLGLLSEYVADERGEAHGDPPRAAFLAELSAALSDLLERADDLPATEVIEQLRAIHREQDDAFAADPVLVHVEACIEELQRIAGWEKHAELEHRPLLPCR